MGSTAADFANFPVPYVLKRRNANRETVNEPLRAAPSKLDSRTVLPYHGTARWRTAVTKSIDLVRIRSALKGKKLAGFRTETERSKSAVVKVGKPKEGFTKSGKTPTGKRGS